MTAQQLRDYCRNKSFAEEDFPFDEETLCFKVGGKIFAITNLSLQSRTVNLKCEPEKAMEWRSRYAAVAPGFHMNKKHWNTVDFSSGELEDRELYLMIDHSYELVFLSLSKKIRSGLLHE